MNDSEDIDNNDGADDEHEYYDDDDNVNNNKKSEIFNAYLIITLQIAFS